MRRGYEDQPTALSVSRALFHLLANIAIISYLLGYCQAVRHRTLTPTSVARAARSLVRIQLPQPVLAFVRSQRKPRSGGTGVAERYKFLQPRIFREQRRPIAFAARREIGRTERAFICRVGGIGIHSGFKNHRVIIESSSLSLGTIYAAVAELADARDLKSCDTKVSYRFDSGLRHHKNKRNF